MPITSWVCYLCLNWLATNQRFPNHHLGSINLLVLLTAHIISVCMWGHWFITKDIKGYYSTPWWRDKYAALGREQRSFCPCGIWVLALWCIEASDSPSFLSPILGAFTEVLLDRCDWLFHRPLMIDSTFSPSLCFGGQVSWNFWKFQHSAIWLVPLASSLQLWVLSKTHLITQTLVYWKGDMLYVSLHLPFGTAKSFKSSKPKIEIKTKYLFIFISHDITYPFSIFSFFPFFIFGYI